MELELAPPNAAWWQYGPPPTPLELVVNTPLTKVIRLLLHALLRAHLLVFHRFRPLAARHQVRGLRGHLVVANHSSHLDGLALMSAFPLRQVNRVRCLCAKDYFFGHPVKAAIAFLFGNSIPMDRDRYDAKAVGACLRELRAGGNVILFPEGSRRFDGASTEPYAGIGFLTAKLGVPVIPAFIEGTGKALPPGAKFIRPGRISVYFGKQISIERRMPYQDIAKLIMQNIKLLSCQPS